MALVDKFPGIEKRVDNLSAFISCSLVCRQETNYRHRNRIETLEGRLSKEGRHFS